MSVNLSNKVAHYRSCLFENSRIESRNHFGPGELMKFQKFYIKLFVLQIKYKHKNVKHNSNYSLCYQSFEKNQLLSVGISFKASLMNVQVDNTTSSLRQSKEKSLFLCIIDPNWQKAEHIQVVHRPEK